MTTSLPTRNRWVCQTHGSTGPFYEGGLCGPCLTAWAKGQGLVATQVKEVLCRACQGAGDKACLTADSALMELCRVCGGSGWLPLRASRRTDTGLEQDRNLYGEQGLAELVADIRKEWAHNSPFDFIGRLTLWYPDAGR